MLGGEKEKFVVGGKLDWEDIKGMVMGIVGWICFGDMMFW